jgi:hypothetical protein
MFKFLVGAVLSVATAVGFAGHNASERRAERAEIRSTVSTRAEAKPMTRAEKREAKQELRVAARKADRKARHAKSTEVLKNHVDGTAKDERKHDAKRPLRNRLGKRTTPEPTKPAETVPPAPQAPAPADVSA